jgi:hypothetical protein
MGSCLGSCMVIPAFLFFSNQSILLYHKRVKIHYASLLHALVRNYQKGFSEKLPKKLLGMLKRKSVSCIP